MNFALKEGGGVWPESLFKQLWNSEKGVGTKIERNLYTAEN